MVTKEDIYDVLERATFVKATEDDMKRSNANVDTDSPMGAMLTYGSETAKMWLKENILPEDAKEAIDDNYLHVHDLDFYGLTQNCCQIELDKLFKGGFDAGHGYIREPNSIGTAASLACIALQCNQNEMFGGQSIPAFDYYMAPYVRKTYEKHVNEYKYIAGGALSQENIENYAWTKTEDDTFQAMEAVIHNLNTMHSRAGAQVPFSSLNYGTDTSKEGRLVTRCLLQATLEGLGHGETPIFPVQIFKLKEGINYNPEDPNYDLFQLAMYCSAMRLFPNFSFIDAPFNLQYYREGEPMTEVATMGCRTRVLSDCNGDDVAGGRGNLSFTTVNLVKCALEAEGDEDLFWDFVVKNMKIAKNQLLHRYEIQCKRHVYNYSFLMGNRIWRGSEDLKWTDEVGPALVHGSLSIGFIGLAEAMKVLYGYHHGENDWVWNKAYIFIAGMRKLCDKWTEDYKLNFTLFATPAEGLSGKFTRKDRETYGIIEGVTDRDYYTNSFHIPVYYDIRASKKIELEGPFHALCNAGHITYVELDGDVSQNLDAFESLIRCAHDNGIGYFAINHPIDRCPICGFTGVIYDECPKCHRKEFEEVPDEYKNLVDIYRLQCGCTD